MDLSHRPAKLCILSKWTPQYEGYGFDLMTKKSGEGHYISMVHEGGPAEATHLEAGDWLIEVNGVNVEKLNHGEVIKLIKESENGTVQLLLAPNETDKWRKRNQVTITSSLPDLVHYITPPYQGKLRSFLNGALDRLVIGKRGEQSDTEPSVYHRYSLPIPSGMSDNVVDWSPSGQSPNGRAEAIPMRRSAHGDGQFVGSLDEQRQKEIADWRDKSLEMLMARQIDQDEDDIDDHDIINQVQDEVSIISPDVDDDDHSIYIDVQRGNNSRPISSNQEKVLVDIHLIDSNSQQDNNSVITNNNNSDTNSGFQDDNRHSTSLTLLDGEFFARQCKVRKDSETADYGFKMDSLPSGGGHFLRSIEPTGPAGISGICQNDRLIEVNNVNVEYTDHDTVVNMIRKSPDCEVTLLVVDEKSYKWFQSRNIRIHHGAGGSLVRYCDHRGLREPGYTLDRPVSIGEDNRRSQLYRRGLSQQSAGTSSDGDVEIKDQRDKLAKQLGPEENVNHEDNEDDKEDKEDVRKSTSTTGTATTTRSSKLNQRESRSTISDWSYGSLSEADRFNRGKTIVRVPDDAPRPRLCSISKDPDGVFGFTLNTYEKGRVKLIADIDPASPAEAAGLLQWDRVIEVNGVNINIENHAQVTGRIKASGNRLHLLVLPEAQYGWYEKAGIVPKSNQSNVIYLSNTDVTRDSITIARSLENSLTNLSTNYNKIKPNLPKKPSFSSSATTTMSNQLTSSMTSSTSESTLYNKSKSSSGLTDDKDEHGGEEQPIVLKDDNQIKELNDQQIGDQSIRNSTISHMIQYNTIDEETTEAIYDHIETHQVSTLPLRKKKASFTKKIFKRSLFGGKKDKIYSTIGSMSNLSIKSDIVMGQSSSREQFNHTEAKITRSATLASEDDVPVLPEEDDENQVQLVVKKDLNEKSSVWSTSSDNIHNNNNNIITMHNNNGITGDQGAMTKDGQKDESESQLLEKLKTLSLRDIKQKSRAESKIQAYHRMQQLNFRQRIAHFEDL